MILVVYVCNVCRKRAEGFDDLPDGWQTLDADQLAHVDTTVAPHLCSRDCLHSWLGAHSKEDE